MLVSDGDVFPNYMNTTERITHNALYLIPIPNTCFFIWRQHINTCKMSSKIVQTMDLQSWILNYAYVACVDGWHGKRPTTLKWMSCIMCRYSYAKTNYTLYLIPYRLNTKRRNSATCSLVQTSEQPSNLATANSHQLLNLESLNIEYAQDNRQQRHQEGPSTWILPWCAAGVWCLIGMV